MHPTLLAVPGGHVHERTLTHDAFAPTGPSARREDSDWPARWVKPSGVPVAPAEVYYRLEVTLDQPTAVDLHLSADPWAALYLNGVRIWRGPHRGNPSSWYYHTLHVELAAGTHVLVAKVWNLVEKHRPWSPRSVELGWT